MPTHWIIIALLLGAAIVAGAQDRPRLRPVPENDQGMTTGPAVGERLPDFTAIDQHGNKRTFDDLKGPKGLMLLVVRSADW